MQTKIITQNYKMQSLIQDFIHNKNIKNNPESLIFLLQGKTGTGKEVFARELHNCSKAKGKFIAVNCAAIPDDLFVSHWFGHRKGSFSGAIEDRKGAFEEARNGTLFLDEIGEIPMEHQAILLRALQEKKGFRVGEIDKERSYNIHRIICATNIDLEKAVAENKFREDLYHRIKVLMIEIPALKDRSDDIPLLINHFLDTKKILPDKLRKVFATYEWPGNVRQLQLELERLCLLSQGNELNPIHCSRELRRHLAAYYEPKPIDTSSVNLSKLFDDLVEKLAKNTHDTWALQRLEEGWKYGEQHGHKTNTCLIDYEFLPNSEQLGNRNTVSEIMKAILACDYMITNAEPDLEHSMKQYEKQVIKTALIKNNANITEAAQSLQIDRATLSRKVSADNELKQFVENIKKGF
jgi:transcriptional regulator with PAS, ATPase and Fis domain